MEIGSEKGKEMKVIKTFKT